MALPFPVLKCLVRSGVARWLPSVRRRLGPSTAALRYLSDRWLATPFDQLLAAAEFWQTDAPDAINAAGAAAVSRVGAHLTFAVAARAERLSYQKLAVPPAEGDMRSFNASLGTIPDYAGPPGGRRACCWPAFAPAAPPTAAACAAATSWCASAATRSTAFRISRSCSTPASLARPSPSPSSGTVAR